MRIGLDISPITPTRSGVGTYCYYLLKHLLALAPDCEFRGFSSGRSQVELGTLRGSVPHRHVSVPTRLLYKAWPVLKWPKVDTLLGGVDVYHATNFFLPPTKSAPRIVSIYDLSFMAVPELCSPKIVWPFSRGVRRFVAEADAVLTCSEATKADIVTRLGIDPAKITVALGAVEEGFAPIDVDVAKARITRDYGIEGPFLLFVGTLEPRKNLPGLLRAFAKVAHEIPHKLVLVGGMGWNTEEIFDTLDTINLGDRIVCAGYLASHAELPTWYSAADAFVFPSFYEGFGLPVLEALTCGCPVITSDNSSLPEVVGEAALQVNPRDEDGLAEQIRRVALDAELRKRLAAQGIVQAQRFSWRDCAQATLAVYRRIAGC